MTDFHAVGPQHPSRGRRNLVSVTGIVLLALAGAAGTAAAAAALLGYAGRLWWVFDLMAHFRVLYFIVLALAAVCFALTKWRTLAVTFALVAVIDLWPIMPYAPSPAAAYRVAGMASSLAAQSAPLSTAPRILAISDHGEVPESRNPDRRSRLSPDDARLVRSPDTGSPALRLATANVHIANRSYDGVIRFVEDYEPDLVLMIETDVAWIEALEQLPREYRREAVDGRSDAFGIAMYSRLPDTRCEVVEIGAAGVPSIRCDVRLKDRSVTVIGTHPVPPVSRANAALRNEQLAAIAHALGATTGPKILLGDLNMSPWSPYFSDLTRSTGLMDVARGRGVRPTWHVRSSLVRTPIDHVLVSDDFMALSRVVGPDIGSDHFPVVTDIRLKDG